MSAETHEPTTEDLARSARGEGLFTGWLRVSGVQMTPGELGVAAAGVAKVPADATGKAIQVEFAGHIDAIGMGHALGAIVSAFLERVAKQGVNDPFLASVPAPIIEKVVTEIIVNAMFRSIGAAIRMHIPNKGEQN